MLLGATGIIYKAWQNTPRPIIYNTADGKGNPTKTECKFLDPLGHPKYDAKWHGNCLICGAESQGGIPYKALLGSSYTDWSRHKCPESDHICPACAFTMMLNTASHRCCLFRYSFVADKQLHICNRKEMRDYLINPPEPPFVMAVAVSQKKHIAFKSMVSYDRENFFCNLEEEQIQVNRQEAKDIISVCEALRGIGFTKDEISAGRIRFDKIKKFKLDAYDKINHLLRSIIGTRLFALCLFVAQKMSEEDAICFLGLTLKTVPLPQGHCSSTRHTKAAMSKEDHLDTICGNKSSVSPAGQQNGQMTFPTF
jgi:CRISPR type IV-associated protein Csf1